MNRNTGVLIAVLVVATAIYYPFSPGGRQDINMRRAEQHIAKLKPLLAADPRFAKIELSVSTVSNGTLWVDGEVATAADKEAADRLIRQSNPPCNVAYRDEVVVPHPVVSPTTSQS